MATLILEKNVETITLGAKEAREVRTFLVTAINDH